MHGRKLTRSRVVNASASESVESPLDPALLVDGLASLAGEDDGDIRKPVDVQMQGFSRRGAVAPYPNRFVLEDNTPRDLLANLAD
jgi:hypothetical protein